jgi:ankyrin repeat protein
MVELLLDSGATVAPLNFEGTNALAMADARKHEDVVARLKLGGAAAAAVDRGAGA